MDRTDEINKVLVSIFPTRRLDTRKAVKHNPFESKNLYVPDQWCKPLVLHLSRLS